MSNYNRLFPIVFSSKAKDFIRSYDKVSHKVWNQTSGLMLKIRKEIREHYIPRQKFLCAYCRELKNTMDGRSWEIDHILPKSKMPEFMFHPENIIICCHECNNSKSDSVGLKLKGKYIFFPPESKHYSIIQPHFDRYSKHIKIYIQGEMRIYKPITNKGRETFRICGLNRFALKSYGIYDEIFRLSTEAMLLEMYSNKDISDEIYQKYINKGRSDSSRPLLPINVNFNLHKVHSTRRKK
ncbi:HNH endonuclease [Klebsiella pneumoniae]